LKLGTLFILMFLLLFSALMPSIHVVYSQTDLVPVSNADIELTFNDGSRLYLSTDSEGRVTAPVRPGIYQSIRISGPTIKTLEVTGINIDSGNDLLNFTVERAQWITGTTYVGTEPASGFGVGATIPCFSDSNGKYAIPTAGQTRIPMSHYPMVMVGAPFGDIQGLRQVLGEGQFPLNMTMVYPHKISKGIYLLEDLDISPFAGQELITHDVNIPNSLSISGIVTDETGTPIANAIVYVFSPRSFGLAGSAKTDVNGQYVIDYNVKDGETYVVQAVARGFTFINTSVTISGDTVFNIELKSSSVIKGQVTDGNGNPLPDIIVFAVSESGWMAYAITDANGYYELPSGFGPGENVTLNYGDKDLINAIGKYGYKMVSFITSPGENVVNLVYDIPIFTVTGIVDDVDRDGFLGNVYVKISLNPEFNIPIPIPPVKVPVKADKSFSIKLPSSINMYGLQVNLTTIDVSIVSDYYYPETVVANNLNIAPNIDLGVIQITSYTVIDVTINVYTTRSSINLPDFHHQLNITYQDRTFHMSIDTNSSIEAIIAYVIPNNGSISIYLVGPTGTSGYMRITLPKAFLGPPYSVYIDGSLTTFNIIGENATHVTLELSYRHSEHGIIISSTNVIPEFPLGLSTLLTMLVAGVIITVFFKRFI